MGGLSSKGLAVDDNSPSESTLNDHEPVSCASRLKVLEVSSLLGRAGTVGLGKAVDVLNAPGRSMESLNLNNGFVSGTKGNKISILAFEVANTIVKGANLMHSFSEENIKHLKEVVLPSEGVQYLISEDMDKLLRMAAADKREELKVFAGEVVRFGNRCIDPQWHNLDRCFGHRCIDPQCHNLDRYFNKLGSELISLSKLKDGAEAVMQKLMTMAQYTAELYHECHTLDRLEQDYRQKLQEEEIATTAQRGGNLQILRQEFSFLRRVLRQELKGQRKHVRSLKKKSLWTTILEEVLEKLVDIVHFLHLEIHDAFGSGGNWLLPTYGDKPVRISTHQRLGSAGLALHYANIIKQIDTLVYQSSSVPQNARNSLYQGLPPSIKLALRAKLQSVHADEKLNVFQIKAEMEKTLRWLVPIATNTTKSHHEFGWVGEWANTGKPTGQTRLIRLETLHHADKEKTEAYMLDLVVWLHRLVSHTTAANGGIWSPTMSPIQFPTQKGIKVSFSSNKPNDPSSILTKEDQEMLQDVSSSKLTVGISKSQDFDTGRRRGGKKNELTKSSSASHSPDVGSKIEPLVRRPSMLLPVIDFDIDRVKALDVIDRVDTLKNYELR